MILSRSILDTRVDPTSYDQVTATVLGWTNRTESRYVCFANVASLMAGHDSTETSSAINAADLVTPDGMPLVWALRLLGHRDATRVYGPDLTLAVLEMAAQEGIPVGLHGGSPAALERFQQAIRTRFPRLEIAYSCSPPFRPLTADEDERVTAEINRSGARILFVGLGTPKQDRWM